MRRVAIAAAIALVAWAVAQPEPGRAAVVPRLLTPTHVCVPGWHVFGPLAGYACFPRSWARGPARYFVTLLEERYELPCR